MGTHSSTRAMRAPTTSLRLARSPLAPGTIIRGLVAGLALAALGVVLGWVLQAAGPTGVDAGASVDTLTTDDAGWLFTVGRVLSYWGHALVVTPLATVLALLARRRWGTWDLGWLLLVVVGGATALTGAVKLLTDRARPDEALIATVSSAFPSGHAVRAVAVYGLVAWLVLGLARRRVVRLVALPAAAGLIALNGVARVAVGAHWPTDVLAGVALGAAWLACSLLLLRPRVVIRPWPHATDNPGTPGGRPVAVRRLMPVRDRRALSHPATSGAIKPLARTGAPPRIDSRVHREDRRPAPRRVAQRAP